MSFSSAAKPERCAATTGADIALERSPKVVLPPLTCESSFDKSACDGCAIGDTLTPADDPMTHN